jgi:Kef-type K+ transport system membrane component KefB/mannitol/fructose-specific phosphotransferase system IIA component (Ntr-type)
MHTFPVSDPVLIFAIVMFIVLVSPLTAEKLKLPGIIGLITAGVIVGPHGFGVLERDSTIELLGTIGLLYIMFQAGLEINLSEVEKNKFHSLSFGLLTFAVPLIIGTSGAMFILNMSFLPSLLLASMFSSHTLLTFPIVSRMGLSKKASVSTTIGGTIITDTLAFLILAVVIASTHGHLDMFFWIKLALLTIAYVTSSIFFLPKLVSWFFKRYSADSGIEEYVFVITVLFILAHISHVIGLEPVIGAFLSGLILNRMIPEKSTLMNRIQFVGGSFFIPFFLISVGMIIDLSHFFSDYSTLKISATMIIIAIVTKYIAAITFGIFTKLKKSETNLMFAMTVNQAAATLAAVMVAYKVGLFGESILTGTIMMIVATCFTGSILTQRFAKEVALEEKAMIDTREESKTDRILVPIKNAENLNNIAEFSFLLKNSKSNEPIYPLTVALEGKDVDKQVLEGEGLLTKMISLGNSAQKELMPLSKIDINVPKAINKTIKEYRISKIILHWKGKERNTYRVFSRVIDQFVKNSNEAIYITNIKIPLGITKNIYTVVPPLITRQKGFVGTFNSIVHITMEMNSKLIVVSDSETSSEIKDIFSKFKKNISYEFINIESWKNIDEHLLKFVKNTDMIIQMIARQGQLAWRLSFDRLPMKIVEKFKTNNYIAIYPTFEAQEEDYGYNVEAEEQKSLLMSIPSTNFMFNIEENRPEKLLNEICNKFFYGNRDIYEDLLEVALKSPIELSKEILLIHTHRSEVEDFTIYIGTQKDGFDVESIKSRPKIIITLLSPKSEPLNKHLRILSEIAKMVVNKDTTGSLLASDSYNDFIKRIDTKNRTV